MLLGIPKVWHRPWRWNRPSSVHKQSSTLPALCSTGKDDTRGTRLYRVLLRVLCESVLWKRSSHRATEKRLGQWNVGHLAKCEGLCSSVCCVWMFWDEMFPFLSSHLIKLTELPAEQNIKYNTFIQAKCSFWGSGNSCFNGSNHNSCIVGPPWRYCLCLNGFLGLHSKIGTNSEWKNYSY